MKTVRLMSVTLMAIIMASCAKSSGGPDEPTPPPSKEAYAMGFFPFAGVPTNRATDTPLESSYTTFKVWSYKYLTTAATETPQTVMDHYNVNYALTKWNYVSDDPVQYLKYWDASAARYIFHAYAPVAPDDGVTAGVSGVKIPGTAEGGAFAAHLTEDEFNAADPRAKDWVVANYTRYIGAAPEGITPLPADFDNLTNAKTATQPPYFYSVVPLRFHHIFSKLSFKIYNDGTANAAVISVKVDIDYPIFTSGVFEGGWNFPAGSATASNLLNVTTEPLLILNSKMKKEDAAQIGNITCEIPQPFRSLLPGEASITITLKLQESGTTNPPYEISGTYKVTGGWNYDSHYVYYIKFTMDGGVPPIMGNLLMAQYGWGDDIDDFEENW